MFNIKETIGEYKNNYSSSDLYEIDFKNKKIKKIWTYDSEKLEFSKVAGGLKELDNKNKLINYGWSINKSNINDNIKINDEKYLKGVVLELDEKDNLLFRARTSDLLYRVYKVNLYEDNNLNYDVKKYEKISDLKEHNFIYTPFISSKLENAKKFAGDIKVYVNRIAIDYEFKQKDNVNVYLVSSNFKTYKYIYKEKNNNEVYSINTLLDSGKYAVYVEINNKMFNTNKVIDFN